MPLAWAIGVKLFASEIQPVATRATAQSIAQSANCVSVRRFSWMCRDTYLGNTDIELLRGVHHPCLVGSIFLGNLLPVWGRNGSRYWCEHYLHARDKRP